MIKHKFFTRHGGVSKGGYSSLNLSFKYGDNKEDVACNQKIILEEIGGDALVQLNQVHGSDCLVINGDLKAEPDADAMVTKKHGIALGIITADCAPVLFKGTDKDGAPVIGAAHAGWRGAVSGVCENTIEKMETLGCERKSIISMIGPCIGQRSYEVGNDFQAPFIKEDRDAVVFFKEQGEKLLFDLSGYVAFRLKRAGIDAVRVDGQDTYALENDFFSYRRATHNKETACGRQMSTIMILNH